jgi:carbonic anhydrase/acetyltransferase-like protein (isoleucine patch superfamily)
MAGPRGGGAIKGSYNKQQLKEDSVQVDSGTVRQLRRRKTGVVVDKSLLPFRGAYPQVPQTAWVAPSAVVIGDVTLGNNASVWPGAVIRCDGAKIVIGAGTNVQDLCCLHASPYDHHGTDLVIGRGVTVGHRVILHGCQIGDDCLIGCGAIVLDGVSIQPHVIVAAGSLVPAGKILESGWLYMGSPVRAVRRLTEKEIAHFALSAEHYIRLANAHRDSA